MCNARGIDWRMGCCRVVALHPSSCLAKWSSVRKFLDATLKKINAESNPNVCHPVFRKFKATSVSKVVSCASFIRVWLLYLGQGLSAQKWHHIFFRC